MSKKYILIVITLLSLLTHFIYFGHPTQTVFDEVHFGKFISGYYTHEYFFDIHPPLGKLLIAGFGKLFDFRPEFSFASIGDKFPDNKYMALRFLPMLAGTLLPLVLFFLALELGFSLLGAGAVGMLVILENSLLVQSRFILLDAFLLLFGFSAFLSYFIYKRIGSFKYLFFAGVLGGMAISIKWTGVGFLGPIGLLAFIELIKNKWKNFWHHFLALVVVPFAIYFSVFAIHFSLLNKSGPGDAFMTPQFRKTLAGSEGIDNQEIKPLGLIGKFVELNTQMYTSNQSLTGTHPYSSSWYSWPLMVRPIYYWVDSNPPTGGPEATERIYSIGNPVIWWGSTIAVLFLIIMCLKNLRFPGRTESILLSAFAINLLPFVGVKRVMFLYHYMPALIIAIFILVYCVEKYGRNPRHLLATLTVAALCGFVFFAPLTYGLPLTESEYNLRTWIKSWI